MKLKVQSSRFKVQIKKLLLLSVFLLFAIHYSPFTDIAFASEKWKGVDESVVEKFAKEYGREARDPLINTDQGDLLLFVFLLAGAVGGFAAGYYWHVLITTKGSRNITKDSNLSASKDK